MNNQINERQYQHNKLYKKIKYYNPTAQQKKACAITLSELHKSIEHKFHNSKINKNYVFPRAIQLSQSESEQEQVTMITQIIDLHQTEDKQNEAPIHQTLYEVHLYKGKNNISYSTEQSLKYRQKTQISPQLEEQKSIKLKHKPNKEDKRLKTEMFAPRQQKIKMISLNKTPKAKVVNTHFLSSNNKQKQEEQQFQVQASSSTRNAFQLDFRRITDLKGQQQGKPLELPRSNKNVSQMKQALKSLQNCEKINQSACKSKQKAKFNSKRLEQFMNSKSLSKKCYQSYSHLPKNNRKIKLNQTTLMKENKVQENLTKENNQKNHRKKIAIKIFEKSRKKQNTRKQFGINIHNQIQKIKNEDHCQPKFI